MEEWLNNYIPLGQKQYMGRFHSGFKLGEAYKYHITGGLQKKKWIKAIRFACF